MQNITTITTVALTMTSSTPPIAPPTAAPVDPPLLLLPGK